MSKAKDLIERTRKKKANVKYYCPWDGEDVTASMKDPLKPFDPDVAAGMGGPRGDIVADPNKSCGFAYRLDCGHWIFDKCDSKSGLDNKVLNVKNIKQVQTKTTPVKKIVRMVESREHP